MLLPVGLLPCSVHSISSLVTSGYALIRSISLSFSWVNWNFWQNQMSRISDNQSLTKTISRQTKELCQRHTLLEEKRCSRSTSCLWANNCDDEETFRPNRGFSTYNQKLFNFPGRRYFFSRDFGVNTEISLIYSAGAVDHHAFLWRTGLGRAGCVPQRADCPLLAISHRIHYVAFSSSITEAILLTDSNWWLWSHGLAFS